MKKATLLSSLVTMAVILSTGCTKSQIHSDLDKKIADIKKQTEQQLLETDQLMENLKNMLTKGGQPGKITLNGAVVMDTDKLDSRITLSQTAGLSRTGSATALAKDLIVLNSLKAEQLEKNREVSKNLEDERTYLNLGCDLAESEIAGLTEVSVNSNASASTTAVTPLPSVSRIFICGEHDFSNKIILSMSASEIMLKEASLKKLKALGSISLSAKTLILIGKNKITTMAENEYGIIVSAADIDLTVTNEIYGDGTLALESKGGNNIAEEKKDSK